MLVGTLGFLTFVPAGAQAAIVTWDGGGADNNWNTVANWVGDVAPGTADVATFDATSVKNATVNAHISVAGIDIVSTYTGTINKATGTCSDRDLERRSGGARRVLPGRTQRIECGEAARLGRAQEARADIGADEDHVKGFQLRGCGKYQGVMGRQLVSLDELATPCHMLTGHVQHVESANLEVSRDTVQRSGQLKVGESALPSMPTQRGVRFCERQAGHNQDSAGICKQALDEIRAHFGPVPLDKGAGVKEVPHGLLPFFIPQARDFFRQAHRHFRQDGADALNSNVAFWSWPKLEVLLARMDGDPGPLEILYGHLVNVDFSHRNVISARSLA